MGALGSLAAKHGAIGVGYGVMAASYAFARLAAGLDGVYADSILLHVLCLIMASLPPWPFGSSSRPWAPDAWREACTMKTVLTIAGTLLLPAGLI